MGTHPIFESDFDCLTEKMILNLISRRNLFFSFQNLQKRTKIDRKPEKQIPTPRYQKIAESAAYTPGTKETGSFSLQFHRSEAEIKPKCPWCKLTRIEGEPAILCSVWPSHNVVIRGTRPEDGEDLWRGINTSREPVDVFRFERYLNNKSFINAKDHFRMTTPVTNKIEGWRKKYGTK